MMRRFYGTGRMGSKPGAKGWRKAEEIALAQLIVLIGNDK